MKIGLDTIRKADIIYVKSAEKKTETETSSKKMLGYHIL